jgi:two-component system chemotaxis response regulator CheB
VDSSEAGPGLPERVVGIGASAGGVDALLRVVEPLPADLKAALCVVLHIPASGHSLLAPILARRTDLTVAVAQDGERLLAGRIYVAPPDRHLIVSNAVLRLERGPKENGVRPAVDPMLRSLAAAYGKRAVAVVLSGALGDGSGGALAVRQAGGTVIVQDLDDAIVPSMPASALRAIGSADAILRAADIGSTLTRMSRPTGEMRENMAMTPAGDPIPEGPERPAGPPSPFTCPECNGSLWELQEGEAVRYQCRVGHAFSVDALVIEQGSAVEAALWSALEALVEREEFLRRVASRDGAERPGPRDRFTGAAEDAAERAELIRRAMGMSGEYLHALDLQAGAAQ